jgi:ADP-ribose pyrophosphatase YjhB (NUDIX family)
MSNSEEILDRVDDNDKVIGQMTRDEKEKNSHNFRVSIICVFNSEGDMLLGKRPKWRNSPGKWACFGGHVSSGESYEDAAHRELNEELGFDNKLKLIGKFNIINLRKVKVFTKVFYTKKDSGFIPDKHEIAELKFFKKEDINRLVNEKPDMFSYSFLQGYKLLKEQGLI